MARKRKRVWKQKTFWSGLAMIVTGIGLCIGKRIPEGSQAIIGGFGLIFLRQAIEGKDSE